MNFKVCGAERPDGVNARSLREAGYDLPGSFPIADGSERVRAEVPGAGLSPETRLRLAKSHLATLETILACYIQMDINRMTAEKYESERKARDAEQRRLGRRYP